VFGMTTTTTTTMMVMMMMMLMTEKLVPVHEIEIKLHF
jgi:hypothetical protein